MHSGVCSRRPENFFGFPICVQTQRAFNRALNRRRFRLVLSALLLKSGEEIPFVLERNQIAMNFPREIPHLIKLLSQRRCVAHTERADVLVLTKM